jgi:hypothetical protein
MSSASSFKHFSVESSASSTPSSSLSGDLLLAFLGSDGEGEDMTLLEATLLLGFELGKKPVMLL